MNTLKIKEIIEIYKKEFNTIHDKEIYKWKATKQFQDYWNPNSQNYSSMFKLAIKYSKNLLDSGNYFPKRMIENYLRVDSAGVKVLFNELFDEEKDLFKRIEFFQKGINIIHKKHFKKTKNTFQDHRAIIYYLCMRYPERYYLYKFVMFKRFCEIVDYPYTPKRGFNQNIIHFFSICNFINQEIFKDNDLIKLHHSRLKKDHYQDSVLHILTQDIIYAATTHLNALIQGKQTIPIGITEGTMDLVPTTIKVSLTGRFTNYLDNEKENKRIGDIAEEMVLEYERINAKKNKISKIPSHDARDIGDGIGYDIKSYDKNGKDIFIEVKATRGKKNIPFFLTQNELKKSQIENDQYFLYRLYELDDKQRKAKLFIINGNLTPYCINPIKYKIALKNKTP